MSSSNSRTRITWRHIGHRGPDTRLLGALHNKYSSADTHLAVELEDKLVELAARLLLDHRRHRPVLDLQGHRKHTIVSVVSTAIESSRVTGNGRISVL
jgi:hypothetical protein